MNRRLPWRRKTAWRPRRFTRACRCLALSGWWLLALHTALAQSRGPVIEPRWLRLDLPEMSVGMEVEGMSEVVKTDGGKTTHDQISYTPLVGMRTAGSIYHPNLVSFNCNGEAGWSWLDDTLKSSGSKSTRNEDGDLIRGLTQVTFLSGKPYNAIFSAAKDHTYRNYDSFSTYTVDTTRYSGRASWTTRSLDLSVDAGYRNEDSSGIDNSTDLSETYVTFTGTHTREAGQTSLNYRYDQFDNTVKNEFWQTNSTSGGGSQTNLVTASTSQTSVSHAIGVSDTEAFGSRRQITANTGLSYSRYEYFNQHTDTLAANENITVEHTPNLDSYLNANYSHTDSDPTTSSFVQGEMGVKHQLYESLASTLEVHGSYDSTDDGDSSGYNDRYGVGVHEAYTKRLAKWGRLSIGGAMIIDHEDHDSSGSLLGTLGEPHKIFLSNPTFLNNPNVITSSIRVRTLSGIPATLNVDYRIVTSGQLTGIQLLIGSTILRDGQDVLVDYDSDSLYTATFNSFNGTAQIRLDLFNLFGIYGRLNWLDNNAPAEAQVQTLTDLVGGVDFNWRWFRASAEYEDYDSNFSTYQAWRFYQSFTWQSLEGSTLSLDFNQIFYEYPDTGTQEQYQFITRYNTQLPFSLAWYVQGGYSMQKVSDSDQDYGFASTGMTWTRGKLTLRSGYMYNYQTTTTTGSSSERREQNYFFAYLKRTF